MKENKKVGMKRFVLMAFVGLFLAVFGIPVQAKKGYFLEMPACACRDNQSIDIYYAYEMGGLRMGITKYNPTTKSKKVIFSGGNKIGNGFYNLTVKGDSIYFIWDRAIGTSESERYLYRIKKNGKGLKKLAKADSYVVKGNKIYYFDAGLDIEGQVIDKRNTNVIRKMNLDGSKKERVKRLKKVSDFIQLALYKEKLIYIDWKSNYYDLNGKKIKIEKNTYYEGTVYCGYDNKGGSVMINGYRYYWNKNADTLYRKDRNNKVNKIIEIKNKYGGDIGDFTVCGNYVLIRCYSEKLIRVSDDYDAMTGAVYSVRVDGKQKHKLKEWALAE